MNEQKLQQTCLDIVAKTEEMTGQMTDFERELLSSYIRFALSDAYYDGQLEGISRMAHTLKNRGNENEQR